MPSHFFISHASQDGPAARRFVAELEARGVKCWLAERDIPGGADWPASLNRAIRTCDQLVLLLSRAANESEHVLREVTLAAEHRKPIYPVALDDHPASEAIKYFISNRQVQPHARALEGLSDGFARFARSNADGSTLSVEATGFMRHGGQSRTVLLGAMATAVALAAIWAFRPRGDHGVPSPPSQSVPASAVAIPSAASAPVTTEAARPLVAAPVAASPVAAPASSAIRSEPAAAAPQRTTSGSGALQPRVSLDGYAPPPAPRDDHGEVRGDAYGPLRPKINLGD